MPGAIEAGIAATVAAARDASGPHNSFFAFSYRKDNIRELQGLRRAS